MIKKITITIGSKDIELTLKQAKELKKDLDELLETKKEFLPVNTWPVRPFNPLEDIFKYPSPRPIYEYNKVTSKPGEIFYNHSTMIAQ